MMRDSTMSLLRHLLTAAGGYLVARGALDPQDVDTLIGAGVAVAGVVWSILAKRVSARGGSGQDQPPAPPRRQPD